MNYLKAYAGYDLTALGLWREARGEGLIGMQAVANVLANRAAKHRTSCDEEVMKPLQFSSMTAPGDKQLLLFPNGADETWRKAQQLAAAAKARTLVDLTHGATLYYAPKSIEHYKHFMLPGGADVPFPASWNPRAVEYATTVGNHVFFREV
ncbi:cell wall hydrolase [Terriglobus sp. ADX1]|uniref:cell wall hydrolase n=1 Tax=Terriglobus sp. ADX1 TaxID=2794063 RepID=UPI002FE69F68